MFSDVSRCFLEIYRSEPMFSAQKSKFQTENAIEFSAKTSLYQTFEQNFWSKMSDFEWERHLVAQRNPSNQIRVMNYSMHDIFESSFRWTKTRNHILYIKVFLVFERFFSIWWDDIKSLFLDSNHECIRFCIILILLIYLQFNPLKIHLNTIFRRQYLGNTCVKLTFNVVHPQLLSK